MKAAEKIETTDLVVFTEAEQKALKDYSITPAEVAKKAKEYMALKVIADDSESYDRANAARLVCVHTRTGVDKRRKKLNEDDQNRIKDRNAAAKKLVAPLAPVEEHLEKELQIEDGRKAEIKAKKAQEELERVQGIRAKLTGIQTLLLSLPIRPLEELNDIMDQAIGQVPGTEDFQEFLPEAKDLREKLIEETTKAIDAREKLNREEAERKAEAERLAKQRAEQEAIRLAQEAEAKRLEDLRKGEEEKTKKEREAIEAEKRKIQETLDRIEFERKAKMLAEAAAKAKVEREAKEKAGKEEADRKEAERREQLRPDKEKLIAYGEALANVGRPILSNKKAQTILADVLDGLAHIMELIKTEVEAL